MVVPRNAMRTICQRIDVLGRSIRGLLRPARAVGLVTAGSRLSSALGPSCGGLYSRISRTNVDTFCQAVFTPRDALHLHIRQATQSELVQDPRPVESGELQVHLAVVAGLGAERLSLRLGGRLAVADHDVLVVG